MIGYRKFTLGLAYMAGMFALAWHAVSEGVRDFTGLGIVAAGIASGVLAVVWGNVKSKEEEK